MIFVYMTEIIFRCAE